MAIISNSNIPFTVHIFKEGDAFVAHVPELDISSCGDTTSEAKHNIKDAVIGFLKTAKEKGTLIEIMEEAGYKSSTNGWIAPEFISLDHLIVNL
jgi:predicted RNase H-like HicB family nuclease